MIVYRMRCSISACCPPSSAFDGIDEIERRQAQFVEADLFRLQNLSGRPVPAAQPRSAPWSDCRAVWPPRRSSAARRWRERNRGDGAHSGGSCGSPLNSVTSRCVSAMPVRGVRTTSSSGGGRFTAGDGFHRAGGAHRISAHDLIHALGHQRIADGVDRIGQCVELSFQNGSSRVCQDRACGGSGSRSGLKSSRATRRQYCLRTASQRRCKLQTVHDVVGGDGFDRLIGLFQLPRHQRRKFAERTK